MSAVLCIHQPDFAPYLGFFHRLLLADHFILLDDVQFIRRGWQHRDRIKNKAGPVWLTLSLSKGDYHQRINEVLLSQDPKWIEDNLNLLQDCYGRSQFFNELFPQVEAIYRGGYLRLVDFNMAMLGLAFKYLNIEIPMTFSSQYKIHSGSSERLLLLVKAAGGDEYLTGTGSREYLDESLFASEGVKVCWQSFKHPVYPQLHGKFEPMLSCLDLLFNCGRDSARILRSTLDDK